MPSLPLRLCAAFLHVATSSFYPLGNMTKKVKLLPNTHTHIQHAKAAPSTSPLPPHPPLPVICKCDNASYSHIAFSVSVLPARFEL